MEHDVAKYKTRTAEYRYDTGRCNGPTVGHLQFFQKNKWQMPRGLLTLGIDWAIIPMSMLSLASFDKLWKFTAHFDI